MATPFDNFKSRLGIANPSLKGKGFNYTPTIIQQGETTDTIGQSFLDRVASRKDAGLNLYSNARQENTNRVAQDLLNKSAGLKFDEFGKPEIKLADFSAPGQSAIKGISQRGNLATQAAESRRAFQNAVINQNLSQYAFTGEIEVSGSSIPGASSDNPGAKAASMALQVQKNGTPYVWGGNSLSRGIDCSGLVQQIYRQLGVQVPRTTYEQAKHGRTVPISDIRPGDLVFYRNFDHVGIYIGNGKIVHAANAKLGVITSNLTNSNGSPNLVIRPY